MQGKNDTIKQTQINASHGKQAQHTPVDPHLTTLPGRRQEALKAAMAASLWSHAFVIAAGENRAAFQETCTQFAMREMANGSPLQTLCLLQGTPSEIFSQNGHTEGGWAQECFLGLHIMIKFSKRRQDNCFKILFADNLPKTWRAQLAAILVGGGSSAAGAVVKMGDTLWAQHKLV